MDSNDEFSIKNCMCCYFDDIIKIEDLILIKFYEMKNHEKPFWFMTFHTKLWCKTIAYWFYNVDGFIKVYDGTRYLVLFDPEKHDAI